VAANVRAATALAIGNGLDGSPVETRPRILAPLLQSAGLARLVLFGMSALVLAAPPTLAASNKVRVSNLGDVAFGSIANLGVDTSQSQNICLYSDTSTSGYNITAAGAGPGGAFQLSSGPSALPYVVQWSSSSGQNSGVQLSPNVPLTGQTSTATQQTCNNGPPTSASLIILFRSGALSGATAGTYSGTLTLVVGPE
jgi:spore coat protein U-like protein